MGGKRSRGTRTQNNNPEEHPKEAERSRKKPKEAGFVSDSPKGRKDTTVTSNEQICVSCGWASQALALAAWVSGPQVFLNGNDCI